jgi:phage gpG-like protein
MSAKIDERDYKDFVSRLTQTFGDVTPALQEVAQIIVDSISENFDVGGRHGTGPYGGSEGATHTWKRSKRAIEQSGMTLLDTGRLATSITYSIGIDRKTIHIGSNVVYAAIHNFGGYNGRNRSVHQIARPFAVIQTEDIEDIRAALTAYYARRFQSR